MPRLGHAGVACATKLSTNAAISSHWAKPSNHHSPFEFEMYSEVDPRKYFESTVIAMVNMGVACDPQTRIAGNESSGYRYELGPPIMNSAEHGDKLALPLGCGAADNPCLGYVFNPTCAHPLLSPPRCLV